MKHTAFHNYFSSLSNLLAGFNVGATVGLNVGVHFMPPSDCVKYGHLRHFSNPVVGAY